MAITARTWVDNTIATAAQLNTIRDDINYLNSQVASQFFLSAQGGTVPTTSGCAAAAQEEFATNKHNAITCAFDGTSIEHIQWSYPLPADYGGGTVIYQVYWYCNNASGNSAVFGLKGASLGDSDAADRIYGTAIEVTDANNANADLNISAASGALTIGNNPVAGDMVLWDFYRDPTDGSDNLTAIDALFWWVKITYTRT